NLLQGQRFPCKPQGPPEIFFLPGQVPRRLCLCIDVPEVEAQSPDSLGCDGLRDPPDQRIPKVIRSTVRDDQASARTLRRVDDSAEFRPSRCARKPGSLDLADSFTRQPEHRVAIRLSPRITASEGFR